MMPTLRLRTRLLSAYALLILVGFGGLAWLAGAQIADFAQQDAAQTLEAHAALMARSLSRELYQLGEEDAHDLAGSAVVTFLGHAAALAAQVDATVALYDTQGRLWYDSRGMVDPAVMPALRGTPHDSDNEEDTDHARGTLAPTAMVGQLPAEIGAAFTGQVASARRLDSVGELTLYAAAPMRIDEYGLGVVQLALPTAATIAAVRRRWWGLGSWVLVVTVLALVASLWLAASLTRPLEALRQSALRLAAGDLTQRVPIGTSARGQDEIGQVATAFNQMAGQVQAMVEEQRAFAGNAAHELRTPLTTIRLRSEALRSGTLNTDLARRYIAEIDDEALRMGNLVEDLVLLSRLDAGRAQRGAEDVDLARLARALLRDLRTLPEAQGKTLTFDAPQGLPTLHAAVGHLRVLLRNLLANAVLYTPTGGTVTCRLAASDTGIVIMVADTGQGVAAEDLPHLHERFYRSDKAHTRAVKGAGLGLALVQSIATFYGATMEIASPGVDLGTTVTVQWPVDG